MANLPEGSASLINRALANPAPGIGIGYTVPTAVRWQILAAHMIFAASAAVLDRFPFVSVIQGGHTPWRTSSGSAVQAGQTVDIRWQAGLPGPAFRYAGYIDAPLAPHALVQAGALVTFDSNGFDAADQIVDASFTYLEWIEP